MQNSSCYIHTYKIRGWSQKKDNLEPTLWGYWPIRHKLAITNGVAMKGKWIIIPFSLQIQILHRNHMGIEKTWLLKRESVNWITMNDIECMVKQCTMCLEYQQTQPWEKALNYEVPCRPREVVGGDVFVINNKTLLCVVDYHSKFPIVKKVKNLLAGI